MIFIYFSLYCSTVFRRGARKNPFPEDMRRGSSVLSSHLPERAAGIGTIAGMVIPTWLPRLHRAVPSTSLDELTIHS
jgi:hypothetical protein